MQIAQGKMAVVAGSACKDIDYGCVGKDQVARRKFSLYLGKGEDDNGKYANCVAWRALAEYASQMSEGDAVLAAGRVQEHEYNGKMYKTLNADFVMIVPAGGSLSGRFKPVEDEELPF